MPPNNDGTEVRFQVTLLSLSQVWQDLGPLPGFSPRAGHSAAVLRENPTTVTVHGGGSVAAETLTWVRHRDTHVLTVRAPALRMLAARQALLMGVV